ncbi:hypothetical protein Afil01_63190 [Actinorhabdospora filicis]|uniref:OmpA-like domain-containing protein n=1 Tax=Actinorhabdospora filicis TaxID=1785913 RepID=A0A9W6STF3_9ACTN|nr:DUF4157 domain-containing protein [Actinorhabdospora filicis]GLZ81512.1 hypothetical protein Afil01_63190 [Actinorhabdospora filicis]
MRHRASHIGDGGLARPAERQAEDAAEGRRPRLDAPPTTGSAPVPGVGEPLAEPARALFEERLGESLDGVRVHSGPAAARAAAERHARAYAVGDHVVLGAEDDDLLAHELAHVVQQRRTGVTGVQHDDEPRTGGIGRTPPRVDYDVVRAPASREDLSVLFARDSADLPDQGLAGLLPLLPAGAQPVRVEVDGYSSREGDDAYNLNLSAHRAAAVQAALALILPPGSEVVLHAHGETAAFGAEAGGNRRAGLRVSAITPRVPVPPPSLYPPRRFPSIVPELELHLDPSLLRPWRLGDPLPDPSTVPPLGGTGAPPTFTPFRPAFPPPIVVPPIIGPTPGTPFQPWLFPGIVPRRPRVDWTGIREGMLSHGGVSIDTRLGDSIQSTVDSEYDRYRGLGFDHELAERLANLAVSSELSRQLAREGNTAIDRSNNELSRMGVSTITVPVITPEVIDRIRRIFGGGSR